MLISPRRTLKSCGSSSMEVLRRNAPTRVRRSSPSTPPGARSPYGRLVGRLLGHGHRAELQHLERPSVAADSQLPEEDRPSHRQEDAGRRRDEERRQEEERDRGHQPVEHVLHAELPAGRPRRPRGDKRQTAEVLHLRERGHSLEEARHDRRGDAEILTAPHDPQQHLVRSGRERDHDLFDLQTRDRVVKIPARPGDRNAELVARVDEGLLVKERDRPEAELRGCPGIAWRRARRRARHRR